MKNFLLNVHRCAILFSVYPRKKLFLFFSLAMISAISLALSVNNLETFSLFADKNNFSMGLPDSTYEDSTIVQTAELGDTIEVYTLGGDSIFVLYEDSASVDSIDPNLWTVGTTQHMIVGLTHYHATIEEDILGANLTPFFEPEHANADELGIYTSDPDPWELLSAMKPKVLRFPSGADSKFMKPLGSVVSTDPLDDMYLWKYDGYGFNIMEIIPFYDVTDPSADAPPLYDMDPFSTSISEDMDDGHCDNCDDWMGDKFITDFEKLYRDWAAQTPYDPTGLTLEEQDGLYINDFIDLVEKIETENDYVVDVVVCLNILNQSATEAKDVIKYLRDNSKHSVHVVGVELGNEVYFDFGQQGMGFADHDDVSAFVHYWDYINGFEYDYGTSGANSGDGIYSDDDFDLAAVLPADVLADHNYIAALKDDISLNVKIGLPAMNLNKCEGADNDFPFIIQDPRDDFWADPPEEEAECPCDNYPVWNDDLAAKYAEVIYAGETLRYKFDAVILHTYYTPFNANADCTENTNWQKIPTCLADGEPYSTAWTYAGSADTRLRCAFDGITGIPYPTGGSPLKTGNFKDFAKNRIKMSYDEHSEHLFFRDTDTGAENKEIWATEWNIHDGAKGTPEEVEADERYTYCIPNTFSHVAVFAHWMLWYMKSNFDTDYRPGFLTTATVQNFMGGTNIDLIARADEQDEVEIGIAECDGTPPEIEDYFVPKPTYFMMQLLSEITNKELHYAKSFISLYSENFNFPPTVFYEETDGVITNVYVYYTNVKSTTQKYAIDPNTLFEAIEDAIGVSLGVATIYSLTTDQLYSTAGKSQIFRINTFYDDCHALGYFDHRFEIQGLESEISVTTCPAGIGTAPTGGVCVTVPATSAGYFVIPVTVYYRTGELDDIFAMFPNPASNSFIIQQINSKLKDIPKLNVELYHINGGLIKTVSITEGQPIDISELPVGVYTVLIRTEGLRTEAKSLVKMK